MIGIYHTNQRYEISSNDAHLMDTIVDCCKDTLSVKSERYGQCMGCIGEIFTEFTKVPLRSYNASCSRVIVPCSISYNDTHIGGLRYQRQLLVFFWQSEDGAILLSMYPSAVEARSLSTYQSQYNNTLGHIHMKAKSFQNIQHMLKFG